jgi:signal transduction histidine kinase
MLVQERAGPLSDDQRRLLEAAETSCARLLSLVSELSELAKLEAGTAPFNRGSVDVSKVLSDAIRAIPSSLDRVRTVSLPDAPAGSVQGDVALLTAAFAAIFHALLRELVTEGGLAVRIEPLQHRGRPSVRIGIGDPSVVEELMRADPSALLPLDEWRGGTGLALPRARRIIDAHGGQILSPPGSHAAAVIMLPRAS